jgi:ferredoxin-type protein NapF
VLGVGKLPYVDFARGGCTLCGGCADACVPQAILGGPPAPAWDLRAHISTACLESQGITCRVCETACDEAALRFQPMRGGRARVIVATDHCTGCGTCLATCPAGAISIAAQDRQSRSVETAA